MPAVDPDTDIHRFCDAAAAGDVPLLRSMLRARHDLVHMDRAANDENTALHLAVRHRHADAVGVLMEAGANARKGIYPYRDATTALQIAQDRGYDEIVAIIEEAEQHRREAASCPNIIITPDQEQLTAAIRAGHDDQALTLLEADPSLTRACDRDGAAPLHVAAEAGSDRLVAWLLEHRANVQKPDTAGRTPLDRAVFAVNPRNGGSLDRFRLVARRLRHRGAPLTLPAAIALGELEAVDRFHRESPGLFDAAALQVNPLGIAVRHRQIEALRRLLDLGLDPDARKRISTLEPAEHTAGDPLWHAVLDDNLEAATLLLDRGADPNAMLYASGTPTTVAVSTRNARMEALLFARGGMLDPASAGLYRKTDLARRMLGREDRLAASANAYPSDDPDEQILWGAACAGDPEIVAMALAKIDWPPDDRRWYHIAEQPLRIWAHGPGFWAQNYPRRYTDCFALILPRMCVDARSRRGETLLHRVASDGSTWGHEVMTTDERLAFATLLLDAGARTDIRDDLLRSTPLAWAARWGRAELVRLLLSRGVPAEEPASEKWATPLAWAQRYRHAAVVTLLEAASRSAG